MSAAVVLAAGSGSRLGGVAKALLIHRERTYLQHIVERVRAQRGGPVIVVVGPPYGDAIAAHARSLAGPDCTIIIVENPDPARGMASSVALGFAALEPWTGVNDAWLWPVDHPFVEHATLAALGAQRGTHEVARPVFQGRRGHPPLISRAGWSKLARCDREEGGARAVIAALDAVDVSVDDPGIVRDIDTPADVEAVS